MIKHKFATLVAVGTFLSLGTGASAQQTPTTGTQMQKTPMQHGQMQMNRSSSSKLTQAEKSFLTKSAQDSLYEQASAQLAVQKATSSNVKQYASRLIQDHTTYNQQLTQLASEKKITLPLQLDAQNKNKLARLQKLNGAAFEREYIQETAKANADDVKDLQRQASTAKDPQVKAFVAQFLPVQQEHLKLASSLKTGKSTASNAPQSKMR